MYYVTRPTYITTELESQFQDYCITKYPEEACAFIIEGNLVIVENISETPKETFDLSSEDRLKLLKAEAFIHSHTNDLLEPSEHDFLAQKSAAIPFGICTCDDKGASRVLWFGDHLLDLPLLERPFLSCALDCFSLIRAVYKQERNIILKDYYREDDWWNNGKNTIDDNIADLGFVETKDTPQKYDIITMSFQSSGLVSHMAIYMGDGIIYHHLEDMASKADYLVRYSKFIKKVYRYND